MESEERLDVAMEMLGGRSVKSPPKVGEIIGWLGPEGCCWWLVTSVMPILTKGRADGKVVEVKVEGYTLGLVKSGGPI